MRTIKGHKSWSEDELIVMLALTGTYTCPTLPHYRYQDVKAICGKLKRAGLIRETLVRETSVTYQTTPLFLEWHDEHSMGITNLKPTRWVKQRAKGWESVTHKKGVC